MTTRVFVYGTLLSGERNHRFLEGARPVGVARTPPRFALYDLGSYPAMSVGGTHSVTGELYQVDAATLARLDQLEGHPRYYRRTAIRLADRTSAETYLLAAGQVQGRPVIASGDWRARGKEPLWREAVRLHALGRPRAHEEEKEK